MYVNNHFTESEGEEEDVIIEKLEAAHPTQTPDVVCLPAGLYTRNNWDRYPSTDFNTSTPTSPWSLRPATTALTGSSTPRHSHGRSGSAR